MTRRLRSYLRAAAFTLLWCGTSSAMERFPPPDFEPGYEIPTMTTPGTRALVQEYLDVVALAVALSVTTYLALARRSRRGVFVVMLASLAYFGFYRRGCVCSIGAIQNVALAVFDPGYAVPLSVILFFALPLVFALLFGRTFCAGVCPLGAIQDVFLIRPVRLPGWLERALGLLAYVYLGAAVVLAATGSAFLICRYDPFVSFFRLSGSGSMLALGGATLAIGVFVGRPYCRFLCPYGAILRQLSWTSKWHVTITPDECIRCRLCEDAGPFGAIRAPNDEEPPRPRAVEIRRLALLAGLLPVLVGAGSLLGGWLGGPMSEVDYTVRLAERVRLEEHGLVEGTTDSSDAFRKTGRPSAELYEEAARQRSRVVSASWGFGGWVGLVVGLALMVLAVKRTRTTYEPDRARCVSCGRCFLNCPRERLRLKQEAGGAS